MLSNGEQTTGGHTSAQDHLQYPTKDVARAGLGSQIVTMMQVAQSWHGYNFVTCTRILQGLTTSRRALRQCKMRSIIVIVADILIHQPPQMVPIQNDDMIEQVPMTVANPAFRNTVLSRAPEAGPLRLDTQGPDGTDNLLIKASGAIEKSDISKRNRRGKLLAAVA
jgi:hypothetical protein